MPGASGSTLRFGLFELDKKAEQLHREGADLNLSEHPYRLLEMLLDRPGELVTREEIRERLWPDRKFLDFEHGINSAARRIRDVLGDSSSEPIYLQTVRGRGYRFIGAIEVETARETRRELPQPASAIPNAKRDGRRWLYRGLFAAGIVVGAMVLTIWNAGSYGLPARSSAMTQ